MTNGFLPPPPSELKRRMTRFNYVMRERKIEAALIVDEKNVRYLSGFSGHDSALLVTLDGKWLLTDFRFIQEAQQSAKGWTVVSEPKGLMEKAGMIARKNRVGILAIEPGAMRLTDLPPLRRAAGKVRLRQEHCLVAELRLEKSAWEIACVERTLRIQETCFVDVCSGLKTGMTERDAAEAMRHAMIQAGADDHAFETMVQFGVNTSMPHGKPTRKKLSDGSVVLVDWGAKSCGYHTDLTRTFFWGKIQTHLRQIHAVVLEAHGAMIDRIKPGVALADLDKAAHAPIDKAGFKTGFCHSAGHGIGLDIHEYPAISEHAQGLLREGMLLALEPGVYLPGVAGVRVEDVVVVTRTGCRVLSRLKHGLRWDGSNDE